MKRIAIFLYGVICYAIGMATFGYMAGFLGNFLVPKSIDSGAVGPLWLALVVNVALLAIFSIQHTVMARPGFKKRWNKIVSAPAERSTYVLLSSLLMLLLCWLWRPMGGTIWTVESTDARVFLYSLYAFGWGLLVFVTFLINHFDLFGLRQVYLNLRGKEYKHVGFKTPFLYRMVRHPLYVGWLIIFWATPTMTAAHLVFALATTAYIFIAIQYEERDLARFHGVAYEDYRREVPMILPTGRKKQQLQEALG